MRNDVEINCDEPLWISIKKIDDWVSDFDQILMISSHCRGELSVLLTNDDHIQKLNATYRHKDQATNVLAFPSIMKEHLGDIVLSYQTIANEALAQEKSFIHHVWHLFLHGYLHLLGYDHMTDDEEKIMQQEEIKILHELGVKNPYEF